MLQAILFDFDGLILETEFPVYEGWREDYAATGHELTLETYAACVGSDANQFDPKSHLESLVGAPIDWEHRDRLREHRTLEQIVTLDPLPGVRNLIAEANALGIPCAVASSSPRSWVEGHLDRLGLLDSFALTRCLDDVVAPKPDPALFLSAATGLGVSPSRSIVLEDSRNGLFASLAAGIPCLIVPNRVTAHLDFSGAVDRLDSLEGVTVKQLSRYLDRV